MGYTGQWDKSLVATPMGWSLEVSAGRRSPLEVSKFLERVTVVKRVAQYFFSTSYLVKLIVPRKSTDYLEGGHIFSTCTVSFLVYTMGLAHRDMPRSLQADRFPELIMFGHWNLGIGRHDGSNGPLEVVLL